VTVGPSLSADDGYSLFMASPDAELDDAVTRAARLLGACNAPVIAIHDADVAGIIAAFRLAERLGAAIDHAGAEAALRDQAVLQDIGLMLVSPAEAWRRADTVLVVGDHPLRVTSGLPDLLSAPAGGGGAETKRWQLVALTSELPDAPCAIVTWLQVDLTSLPSLLGALRARINGRPVAPGFAGAVEVERLAALLKAASFGVALWSADELATLTIEMLAGLIKDLNVTTRWSGLPIVADPSRTAAAMTSGWMTGLPLRVSYAGDRPTHDPWQFDARRMIESGEADAVIWVSALADPVPDWIGAVPSVVLSAATSAAAGASIAVRIGRPGGDHNAIRFDRATGTLTHMAACAPSELPSVAEVLRRLFNALAPP
jgi:formylmethanofuran dehydrogenase subunit B